MKNDAFYNNEYKLPSIIRGNVRIDWVNLGEGNDGDYDPSDPDDVNLLRFDVFRFDGKEWEAIEDGSYCTLVPANTNHAVLREILSHFMDTIYDDVSPHGKAKRVCESLSWTTAGVGA
jgi:hypothetical protein